MKQSIKIGYLYGDLMNIYGDTGNIIALQKRGEWRGIEVKVEEVSLGKDIKKGEYDLFFFGGGQDQSQNLVAQDLFKTNKAKVLKSEIERGVPLLSICGGYQLLGHYYQPFSGDKLKGVGIFEAYTNASNTRMIGNIVIQTELTGTLVGFENHSGKTILEKRATSLGQVIKGFGNT
jgi:CobQ-like glutamine amidotransferase family enzyme